jgi:tRNA 2-thiouridine synthesizing protein D
MPEMKFALLITAAPFSQQGAATALRFAQAAVKAGHCIERVFFFRDGVHSASTLAIAPQDEANVPALWQQFCREHNIDAITCVSAALKRGIVDARESQRHQRSAANIADGMQIGGLGLLTEAIIEADRVVTFG